VASSCRPTSVEPRQRLIPGLTAEVQLRGGVQLDHRAARAKCGARVVLRHAPQSDAQSAKKDFESEQEKLSRARGRIRRAREGARPAATTTSSAPATRTLRLRTRDGPAVHSVPPLVDVATRGKLTIADQVNIALDHARSQIYPNTADLAALITAAAGIYVLPRTSRRGTWSRSGRRSSGSRRRTSVDRPASSGRRTRPVGPAAACQACGALLTAARRQARPRPRSRSARSSASIALARRRSRRRARRKRHKSRKDAARRSRPPRKPSARRQRSRRRKPARTGPTAAASVRGKAAGSESRAEQSRAEQSRAEQAARRRGPPFHGRRACNGDDRTGEAARAATNAEEIRPTEKDAATPAGADEGGSDRRGR
jgi:hypothetical protein